MTESIYLIGFMGAGKTTVGKLLAKKLNYEFVDLDQKIEDQSEKSIPEIFSEEGEDTFRRMETQVLLRSQNRQWVIATGGGIVLREENRIFLKNQKNVFFLDKKMDDLLRHLQEDQQTIRPLIVEKNQLEIAELYEFRRPLYEESATEIISICGDSPNEISEYLYSKLTRKEEGESQ